MCWVVSSATWCAEGNSWGHRARRFAGIAVDRSGGTRMGGGRVSGKTVGRLLAFGVMGLGAAVALLGSADRAEAADRRGSSGGGVFVSEMNDVQRVKVVVNKSRTFQVDTAFA